MNALSKDTHFDMMELITFVFFLFFSCCLVKPENKFQCAKQVRGIYVLYPICNNNELFSLFSELIRFLF